MYINVQYTVEGGVFLFLNKMKLKSDLWVNKIRHHHQSENKVEPFTYLKKTCIKTKKVLVKCMFTVCWFMLMDTAK